MSHPRRHALIFQTAAAVAAVMALTATLSVMRHYADLAVRERVLPGEAIETSLPETGMGPAFDPAFAMLFRARTSGSTSVKPDSVASRFRLVGVMPSAVKSENATAILEERTSGAQRGLRVGELLEPEVTIKSIAPEAVWVTGPAGDECLVREGRSAGGNTAVASTSSDEAKTTVEARHFGGVKTGDHSWTFSRAAIMDYYQELMDRPERLVKVFDSLAPIYNTQRQIEGYEVKIEGEKPFFDAVGLEQGDVVRSVNSIEMTNRRRAENLIRRFAQNELDLVVFEIERNGAPVKQIYRLE